MQFAPQPVSNAYILHQWAEEKAPEWEATRRAGNTLAVATEEQIAPQAQPPTADSEPTKPCPFCAEKILAQAIKCRFCGEIVDVTRRQYHAPMPAVYQNVHVNTVPVAQPQIQRWSPGVAALLSFIIPGLGQLYKGSAASGILWFFATMIGYAMFIVPGLILHLICICAAASGDPTKQGG